MIINFNIMKPIIISIQGNIGSGKSTLIKNFKKQSPAITVVQEPVDQWTSYQHEGVSILEKFYQDKGKYAFPFQMMAFYTRLKAIISALDNEEDSFIVIERSLETDRSVFAKMLTDEEYIDPLCARIYNEWFEELTSSLNERCTIINVYIRTPPSVCLTRVNKRARTGELVGLEYLQKCHSYHEKWLLGDAYEQHGLESTRDLTTALALGDIVGNVDMILDGTVNEEDILKEFSQFCSTLSKSMYLGSTLDNDDSIYDSEDERERDFQLALKKLFPQNY